jgi:hypothetical protein
VALLPENYDQDGLASLYRQLKAAAAAVFPASAGPGNGKLALPLLGKHPRQGVQTADVVQELLSFAEHCGRCAPGLSTVEVFSGRPDSYRLALQELQSPQCAVLLAPQLPVHLAAMEAAVASPLLPKKLRWPCEAIVLAAQLRGCVRCCMHSF